MNLNNLNLDDLLSYVKKGLEDLQKEADITTKPKVRVLADSYSIRTNKRLTTLECTFWRPILPEITRHRSCSFSVRSSRAVPVSALIEEVKYSPWGPEEYGLNQKGMQAEQKVEESKAKLASHLWLLAARSAANTASQMERLKIHKQVVNRLLEPFICTHAVISATEWDNFFNLRISPLAQPEMQTLARAMKDAMDKSVPQNLHEDLWHLPYISQEELNTYPIEDLKMASAARCARVSYKPFNEKEADIEKDIILAKKLIEQRHYSPLEHIACPAVVNEPYLDSNNIPKDNYVPFYKPSNFIGWNQYRKFLEE